MKSKAAPLETIGLFGFAWVSIGPPHAHWIAPLIFSTLIAIANYCIYMATIDYMIASYGPYAASATGGNALARDFLAGIAALYSTPFYEHVGHKYKLEWPTTILGGLAFLVTIPIYVFYWKGPQIRENSKFAQLLASDRQASVGTPKPAPNTEAGDPEAAAELDSIPMNEIRSEGEVEPSTEAGAETEPEAAELEAGVENREAR